MSLTRREFGQRITAAGVGLALSEIGWRQADRYRQAIGLPARRKLALLIGINQYPESVADRSPVRGSVLTGCLTDVQLQRELLTARFGFLPADILTLTDQQATRAAIVDAFCDHLGQARADDAIVVHFSGLGSRVKLDAAGTQIRNTIVPIDATLPSEEDPDCTDLFAETIDLLLSSIASDRVTAILDVGFSSLGTSMLGNLRLRARPTAPVGQISDRELALQQELRQGRNPMKTILTAAAIDQPAVECQWNGFSAGLFTYALTQQLWQTTPQTKLIVTFERASAIAQRTIEPPPQLRDPLAQSAYEVIAGTAEGVVVGSESADRFRVWLGGLPAVVAENYAAGSLLTIEGKQAIVRAREGLVAIVRWVEPLPPPTVGQLVQEAVRLLPPDIGLSVALDRSLRRIERVDATSAFAALPHVAVVIAGEHADYLFGKLQAPTLTASLSVEPETLPLKGYGLFQADRSTIANTLVEGEEAVKTAVTRLAPYLQTLLAIKLLRLTENQASSQLGVEASLAVTEPQSQIIMQQSTARSHPANSGLPNAPQSIAPVVSISSQIHYQIRNLGDRPVYPLLISLDSEENATAYFPTFSFEESIDGGIAPGATVTLAGIQSNALGWVETHCIFSCAPFHQAATLTGGSVRPMLKPIDLVQAVLQDLHQASLSEPTSAIALNVNDWATFAFAYRLVS